jgi:hypothetical protein
MIEGAKLYGFLYLEDVKGGGPQAVRYKPARN